LIFKISENSVLAKLFFAAVGGGILPTQSQDKELVRQPLKFFTAAEKY
jgi:hypothetical protein